MAEKVYRHMVTPKMPSVEIEKIWEFFTYGAASLRRELVTDPIGLRNFIKKIIFLTRVTYTL